jgi:N-methylhydantoinase A
MEKTMTAATAGVRIGVDIGGTFTDLVLTRADGRIFHSKISSTPAAPEQAVLNGVRVIIKDAGVAAGDVTEVVHGTTVGSNTLLQKVGAPTGLITTRGFRDVLEIGRLRTPGMFDLQWEKPQPLIPRRHRLEVNERIAADGSILTPLDEAEVLAVARELVDAGITSLAVCFLNSYRNPVHEEIVEKVLGKAYPKLKVTTSVSVLPEAKEYERTSTTAVNAYVRPVLEQYLTQLESGLGSIGIHARLLVCNSNGALSSSQTARAKPVFFISSGRAAGAAGGAKLGEAIGLRDMVVFDMGGTTASASLVQDGELSRVTEYEFRAGISTPSRFIKAGGYMMSVPSVDVAEVGSGAGSIAHIDEGGLMRVGPVSAGADPGPVCYGTGGDRPTVTDANLVLGYLPTELAGGSRELSVDKARAVIDRDLGSRFGLTTEAAARGVRDVVNANMARAIRAVTVERGVDPRNFTLVAIGGSGPVHAADIARILSMPRVLVPASPGVFTAMGMLAGDVERYFIRSLPGRLTDLDQTEVSQILKALRAEAREALLAEGIGANDIQLIPELNMRFRGQELFLPVPLGEPANIDTLRATFLSSYESIYSYAPTGTVETVSIRLIGRGLRPGKLDFRFPSGRDRAAGKPKAHRRVFFGEPHGWLDTPIYDRTTAPNRIQGPAIIEATDSTVTVPPGVTAEADDHQNILLIVS